MAISDIKYQFRASTNALILLDYDGTLVEIAQRPEQVVPSPRVIQLLTRLSNQAHTTIVVISGRKANDIEKAFSGINKLCFIAEHGAIQMLNGHWMDRAEQAQWKQEVLELFYRVMDYCPGTFIEEKKYSIAFHYREANDYTAAICTEELLNKLQVLDISAELQVLKGNKVIEVMNKAYNKGTAAEELVNSAPYDFILAIGDDTTDEELFKVLNKKDNAFTVKVGPGQTAAQYRIDTVSEVLDLLENLKKEV